MPPHVYVQMNKTQEGIFLFSEGFSQKAPWRTRHGAGAGSRDEGGK